MSAPSTANRPLVLPQTEWIDILRTVAIETFATMAGIKVRVPVEDEIRVQAEVTAMVGITGPLRAVISIRCSAQAATAMSSDMLRVPLEGASAQRNDAVGEICNVIAGCFKAKIGLGELCFLSVPTVLCGSNYQVHSPGRLTNLSLPLVYEAEPIWIALGILQ